MITCFVLIDCKISEYGRVCQFCFTLCHMLPLSFQLQSCDRFKAFQYLQEIKGKIVYGKLVLITQKDKDRRLLQPSFLTQVFLKSFLNQLLSDGTFNKLFTTLYLDIPVVPLSYLYVHDSLRKRVLAYYLRSPVPMFSELTQSQRTSQHRQLVQLSSDSRLIGPLIAGNTCLSL